MVAALASAVQLHAREAMTVAKWTEDIAIYQAQLEANHIDLFHTISREEFERQLVRLRADLPNRSDAEILAELMRLTRLVGDGHTSMPLWNTPQPRFPLEFRWIDGEAVVVGASKEHADMLGAVVHRWNGRPMEEVYHQLATYVPFVENKGSEAVRVAQYLSYAALSQAVGLSENAETLLIEISYKGKMRAIEVKAIEPTAFRAAITERLTYRKDLSDNPTVIAIEGIRLALLRNASVAYIQFDRYPSFEEMSEFADKAARALDEAGTQNLVIDFRENFGGDFFIGLAFVANLVVLDKLDWKDGVYVLTSGRTFSAAMSNSAQFADILIARIIGEPTGANPCGYQDMGQFTLPNSGHLVTYSKRRFCFSDPVNDAVAPDVTVRTSRQNYVDGIDPVLTWVIEDIRRREVGASE
ncbi:hypothetical protein EH31_17030 [Erythrobacter longus]|uniref:Tail specific protease domain-containing protein n=1 Tax=Erythrobacter longus TaxID=1044 RepID=A0A074MA15_ERYLO|nr:hypothetical protein [Erythrobacter longus]KEO88658.1 hypothetical protein EH31_17030 [Erythrobacter longus]